MINKIHSRKVLYIPIILILLSSCVAIQDSKMAMFFHNVTAHYNIYFNAYQKYLQVIKNTEESYVDEYSGILKVFRFPSEDIAKSNASLADVIITKCTKILEKHKISKWIDDSYYLIARTYFYKGDYYEAIELFQYLQSEYPNTYIAYESMIWMALSQYQLGRFDEAQALVSLIKSDQNFPEKFQKMLLLTEAHLNINQKDYLSAIENLLKAIPKEKDKILKTRYMFILGQLYYRVSNFEKAIDMYEKVIKRNPPYEMAFNAKIEIPRCFTFANEREARPVRNMLDKMLKDDKNIQYQDQIYFELAMIELKLGNVKKAEEYFKESIRLNKSNDNQKALAYLKLGQYYYTLPNYPLAKSYFDSTSIYLTENYPEYKSLMATTTTLNELLKNIVLADTEDSLQYLALLPEKSRDSIIEIAFQYDERIKREAEEKERERKLQEEQEMRRSRDVMQSQQMGGFMPPPSMGAGLSTSNSWYFYNQSTLELGKSEFMVRWGKRKLEDNWRRSQKSSVASGEEEISEGSEEEEEIEPVISAEEQKMIDEKFTKIPKEKQPYYINIPFTQSQIDASRKRELEARKKTGDIFLESLKDTNSAIAAYEKLLSRFPDSKYNAQIHYTLYNLYKSAGKSEKEKSHRDTILTRYPQSDYALLIKDPNYFIDLVATKSSEINALYDQTYTLYMEGKCTEVIENVDKSNKQYPGNYKKAYFEYLKVLCKGKNSSTEDFIDLLTSFQQKYKNTELNNHAGNLIAYLGGDLSINAESPDGSSSQIDSFLLNSPFKINNNSTHYFLYFFDGRKVNTSSLKTSFSEYNAKYYSLENLIINTISLENDKQILVIQSFNDKDAAVKYLNGILKDSEFLQKIKNTKPEVTVINEENFSTLIKDKNIREYLEFFKKYGK